MTSQYENRPAIRSTWRDPVGKPLTDRIIVRRMKEGFYGLAAKQAALNGTKFTGFVEKCHCGEWRGVKWYKYLYLEKPMFLCHACLIVERAKGKKRQEQEKKFNRKVTTYEEFC